MEVAYRTIVIQMILTVGSRASQGELIAGRLSNYFTLWGCRQSATRISGSDHRQPETLVANFTCTSLGCADRMHNDIMISLSSRFHINVPIYFKKKKIILRAKMNVLDQWFPTSKSPRTPAISNSRPRALIFGKVSYLSASYVLYIQKNFFF